MNSATQTQEVMLQGKMVAYDVRKSGLAVAGLVVLIICVILLGMLMGALFPVRAGVAKSTPPGVVFSIVWPILYALIASSLWLLLTSVSLQRQTSPNVKAATITSIVLLLVQLILNYTWTPVYNGGRGAMPAVYVLLGTLAATLATIPCCIGAKEWVSAALLSPYAAWLVFALVLNVATVEGAVNKRPATT